MNKQDIIDQWHEDQKPVDPETLSWEKVKEEDSNIEWKLFGAILTYHKYSLHYAVKLKEVDVTLFDGKIHNQGQLRCLMNMLYL